MLKNLTVHKDERGRVFEIFRSEDVEVFGQVYVSTIAVGSKKGCHYHKRKNEIVCCLVGKVELRLNELDSDMIETVLLESSKPSTLYIPTYLVHSFYNVGEEEAMLLFHISEQFNSFDTDTFSFEEGK
jgi:dTDP-4-dehydrorhamnose 3,5-epimerase-like enzyme